MNILAIGNSFSEDATRYLHSIACADGVNINVINLYIGGCSLEKHYRNMLSGERKYELQVNGNKTGFYVSMSEALLNRRWDIITLQQVSNQSFDVSSYEPYITELVSYVRKCSPKAKIYLHQTWAYENESPRLLKIAGYPTPDEMLDDIVKAYAYAARAIKADGIIPSGELFGMLIREGVTPIYRDTYHASLHIGRYALGALWYRILLNKSISDNSFCDFDTYISEEHIAKIKACVDSFCL